MRNFYSLVLMLLFAVSVQSQTTTIWLGGSTDWDDPTNWSDGIPASGFTVTIPATPPNGNNFPVFSGGPLLDFTIQSFGGSITFNSVVYNTGSIVNSGGGSVINNSVFINAGMVTFNNNNGTFFNNGTVDNYGTFNNAGTSIIENPAGSVFNNYGNIDNFGTINNSGTLLNNGEMVSTSTILNDGTITNNGLMDVAFGGTFTNASGGNIVNSLGAFVEVNTDFTNAGTITTDGSWFVQVGSTLFDNSGSFTSNGRLDISGLVNNSGTLVSNDEMFINDSGKLDNYNIFTNNGTLNLSVCGQLIQNANNNIGGTILNDGIIYVLSGSVAVTSNLDFGSEFTDLSQRKAPDTKCRSGLFVFLDENGEGSIDANSIDKNSYGFCGATLVSRVLSQDEFTVADLGVNEITLTTTDNFGFSSSCTGFITVVDYFPPVVDVDDPDIDFTCPSDITVTPLAGAPSVAASWTVPTATTTCTGGNSGGEPSCASVPESIPGFNFAGEFADSKYYVSTSSSYNYSEALALAANSGGHLVTISDAAENQYVKDNLPVGSSAWLGYSDEASEGNYVWVTGEPTTYTNWDNGEPNDSLGTDNFARIRQNNGKWTDRNGATNYYHVVLEIDCQQSVTPCTLVSETIAGYSFLGEFNNSKYYVSTTSTSWSTARDNAIANNGNLVTINDAAENDYLRDNTSGVNWIGLTDSNVEGTFEWASGEPLTYTNWYPGEPNNVAPGEDVVEFYDTGLWNDNVNSLNRNSIMEIACSPNPPSCADVSETIAGATYIGEFGDSKFYVSNQAKTWTDAKTFAEANNGHLAVIDSQAENDFIQNSINPASGSVWIGLNNDNNGNNFSWVNNDPVIFTNWNAGEPNETASHVAARLRNNTGKWTDRILSNLYEVVMEIPCDNSAPSCEDVNLQITFDNYPEDISWVINDSNGSAVASGGNYGNEPNGSTVNITNCLPIGCYDFVLTDSYGDGLCCNYGNGSWSLENADGTLYGSGAQFTTTQTASFCIITGSGNTGGGNDLTVTQISGGQNGGQFPIGDNEVSYSVTDNCGNQEICTFIVTVEENPADITVVDCPADIIVDTDPGAPTASVSWTAPIATTDCYKPNTTIEQTIGQDSGTDFLIGTQNIAYSITDSCGNFVACSFNVTVNEVVATLTLDECPGDQSIQVAIGETSAVATWNVPTGTSNCYQGSVVANQLVGLTSGSSFPLGVNQVVYVLTDECGNSALCAFNITVSEVCPDAGTACDDGDASTENDVEDGNCNCAGTPCPTVGTGCDDGDASTENDVEDGNCNCAGTPCPTAGTTCDDGDATTENDIEDGNCNCAGTPILCPDAGTACDDGDATTENDVEDGNCNCAGTPCPTVGTTCDDGDPNTENDIADGTCGCAGTPIVVGCSSTENLSLKPIAVATQSSTQLGAEASRAIDGDTNGDFFGGNSVSLTNWESNAWWEIDLGLVSTIETINIYNREDCCQQFLSNYYIFISDVPFASADLNATINQAGVISLLQTDQAGIPSAITINEVGRYVRIQLVGTSFLGLAEVEVIGCIAGTGCAPAGTICDDGDATTENDMEDGNCGCAGTPCPIAGTTCDDGNPNTENDVADGTCGCAGTPIGGGCTVTENLALNGTATESSVQLNADGGRAIDGNTNGDFWNGNSVALTNWTTQPWIEVDLGVIGNIETVNVWNRTDCCQGFLRNYYILVSDVPFSSTDLTATLAQAGVDGYFETAPADFPTAISINRTGRYVRIQLQGTSFLGIAELEIIGCVGGGGCPAAGTACDDGDASTENDVEDGNCGCAGTPCPTVGTTCDDGDANTINDMEDGNCNCTGTPINCPDAGTPCDDGDAATENDVEDGNCGCAGTPCPTSGTSCDDGDASTENDMEDGFCNCVGTPIGGGCTTTSNLALTGTASQSSTLTAAGITGSASKAIDGNTNGVFFTGNPANSSVSATNNSSQPYWEVELDASYLIEQIDVYNRTDGVDQTNDIYVLVSDVPFTSTDLAGARAEAIWEENVPGLVGTPSTVLPNIVGRYVRVQMENSGYLVLAEVEVIGCTDPSTSNYAVPNMLYFNAKKNGIHTNIDWLMAKDVTVDFYEVEVSTDGNSFRLLDEMNAAQVNSPRQYDMVDLQPAFGENFYRLKVNQLDGSYFYSNIRRVNFEIDFDNVIVFPNPTNDNIHINMRDFAGKAGTIEIYNNLGQKMMERTYLSFPSQPAIFDVSGLTNGMFTISIKVDNHKRFTKKFVVSKL